MQSLCSLAKPLITCVPLSLYLQICEGTLLTLNQTPKDT